MRAGVLVVVEVAVIALALAGLLAPGCHADYTVNKTAVGKKLDNMRRLEASKQPLDPLPRSEVHSPTDEKTGAEKMAEDEDSIFVGRDVEALTHPTITSKVPEAHRGRGHIQGHQEVCDYLLQASLGVPETVDLHGPRLYNLAARLECEWAACRLCQQRMRHVFEYCVRHGAKDWLLRGVCEDKNEDVMNTRLAKMVFHNNPNSCRVWRDMHVLQQRCSPDDAAFCQGAHTVSEMCKALGLNSERFLQRTKLQDMPGWFCSTKAKNCGVDYTYFAKEGVEVVTPSFGDEEGALGFD